VKRRPCTTQFCTTITRAHAGNITQPYTRIYNRSKSEMAFISRKML